MKKNPTVTPCSAVFYKSVKVLQSELPSFQLRCCAGSWEPDWKTGLYSSPSHPQRTGKMPHRTQCYHCSPTTGILWQDFKMETGSGLSSAFKHCINSQHEQCCAVIFIDSSHAWPGIHIVKKSDYTHMEICWHNSYATNEICLALSQ